MVASVLPAGIDSTALQEVDVSDVSTDEVHLGLGVYMVHGWGWGLHGSEAVVAPGLVLAPLVLCRSKAISSTPHLQGLGLKCKVGAGTWRVFQSECPAEQMLQSAAHPIFTNAQGNTFCQFPVFDREMHSAMLAWVIRVGVLVTIFPPLEISLQQNLSNMLLTLSSERVYVP